MRTAEDECLDTIKDEFRTPDLLDCWSILLQKYETMGFTDQLTDAQRIEEFSYIVDQYRKFIGAKEKPILSYSYDLNKMLYYVEELIEKTKDKSNERKVLVYYVLRNEWLIHLRNLIYTAIEMLSAEKEMNNEWR